MNRDRFRFFTATHHQSDLLVGVPHIQYQLDMEENARLELVRLRDILLAYSKADQRFADSLTPVPVPGTERFVPEEVLTMIRCGLKTGTGPMSAVAGLFAEYVGLKLKESFSLDEVVIENGGDLFLQNKTELISVIHAGTSPLSDKMAFVIPPGSWGICTSSGTMGHSLSMGNADAVTVIAGSTPLADAWATSLANQVEGPNHIEPVLDQINEIPHILGCAIIVGDRIGIRGDFEVKLLS